MNENADKYDKNIGSDDDNQSQAKENECEDLVIFLQNNVTLSFENVEGMSVEERIIIKNIIENKKHNQDEKAHLDLCGLNLGLYADNVEVSSLSGSDFIS